MSRFDLVPLDEGEPVHVPPGETVLGRGPFLRVADRRVSRSHGLLENIDGQLRLKATHLNPCFIQSSLSDDPQPLQKGEWCTLHHGEFFSLLPGQFIFRVEAVEDDPPTPRNSQLFEGQEEEGELEQNSPPAVQTSEEEPSTSSMGPKQGDSANKAAQEEKNEVNVAPTKLRTRILPAWMMEVVTSASKKPAVTPKVQKQKATTSSASRKAAQATPTQTYTSPEEAQSNTEERPRKKRSHEEEPPHKKSDGPSHQSTTKSDHSEDEDDSVSMSTIPLPVSATGRSNGTMPTNKTKNTYQNSLPVSSTSAAAARVRTPCQYGKDCYRKNPLHFQECSHPGDADYQEEEEEDEEEKELPECPYGTDCYRKNPLHRKEYKHTRRPGAPPTRAVNKRSYRDEDEDEDEDEYEDSFIDDESVEGDDSDYVPPRDSDESIQEDSQHLQEEAQRLRQEAHDFLKKGK